MLQGAHRRRRHLEERATRNAAQKVARSLPTQTPAGLINAYRDIFGRIPFFGRMLLEHPSFTIEFPEHLSEAKRQYCLDHLKNIGALVEPQSERVFLITCLRPQQVAHVGWALFHTHFQNQCRVISTSRGTEARASAYPKPSAP